nr:hypothetical protein [Lentibacter algarum]
MAGAVLRAILMALLVAMPALILPGISADSTQIVVLAALLAFLLTFIEYYSQYPSIIEFRYASPFNRLRFFALFVSVTLLSVICANKSDPTPISATLSQIGVAWGNVLDFPFSPVRLVVLMMPENASETLIASVRTAAGLSYFISIIALFVFITLVRLLGWPTRNRAFNVWINLPLFDPTAGGDVVHRLKRDAGLNIVLGVLLPFLIPAVVKATSSFINPLSLENPQTLIWTMTAWAFLPTSMIMRGVAMGRIAELIEEKRNRAYSSSEQAGMQTA